MEIVVKGNPKEIAALVVAIQERQGPMYSVERCGKLPPEKKQNWLILFGWFCQICPRRKANRHNLSPKNTDRIKAKRLVCRNLSLDREDSHIVQPKPISIWKWFTPDNDSTVYVVLGV